MAMLKKVIQYVNESFLHSATGKSTNHFEETLHWLLKLKPGADEAMQIAAYAHDIERAFRKTNTEDTFKNIVFNDPGFLRHHQETGAQILSDFLHKEKYDPKRIERVVNMVKHHEEGGDPESDLIKDADSLSYLETNMYKHIKESVQTIGKEKVKGKIDWMYNRITSPKAKEIAFEHYKKGLELLSFK